MRNRKVLVAAALMTWAMSSQAIAAPMYGQSGKTNKPTNGATTCFDKYLVLDDNADVPNYKSVYTIAPGNAVAGTKDTPEVFAGINADKISITMIGRESPRF